jgi:hypothetical protein
MISEAEKLKLKSEKIMSISMFATMSICLIIITIVNFSNTSNCSQVQILTKKQIINKYFYQLSNGSSVWSDSNFEVKEHVCLSTPNQYIAQK